MNNLKKVIGLICIGLGIAAAYFAITALGVPKLSSGKQEDLVFGIIITFVLTPIVSAGLIFFGKYALSGEYNQ